MLSTSPLTERCCSEANAPKQQAEPAAELPKFKWYQTKTKLMLTVMIPESK